MRGGAEAGLLARALEAQRSPVMPTPPALEDFPSRRYPFPMPERAVATLAPNAGSPIPFES